MSKTIPILIVSIVLITSAWSEEPQIKFVILDDPSGKAVEVDPPQEQICAGMFKWTENQWECASEVECKKHTRATVCKDLARNVGMKRGRSFTIAGVDPARWR